VLLLFVVLVLEADLEVTNLEESSSHRIGKFEWLGYENYTWISGTSRHHRFQLETWEAMFKLKQLVR